MVPDKLSVKDEDLMNLNRTDIVIDDDLSEGEASTPEETQLPSASQTYYPVKRILDEKRNKYLMDWEGTDPSTGKAWLPSWELKSSATDHLIQIWERSKKKKSKAAARRKSSITPVPKSKARVSDNAKPVAKSSPSESYEPVHSTPSPETQAFRASKNKAISATKKYGSPTKTKKKPDVAVVEINSSSESDDDEVITGKGKGKGKARAVVVDSEEDDTILAENVEMEDVQTTITKKPKKKVRIAELREAASSSGTVVPDSQSQGLCLAAMLSGAMDESDSEEEEEEEEEEEGKEEGQSIEEDVGIPETQIPESQEFEDNAGVTFDEGSTLEQGLVPSDDEMDVEVPLLTQLNAPESIIHISPPRRTKTATNKIPFPLLALQPIASTSTSNAIPTIPVVAPVIPRPLQAVPIFSPSILHPYNNSNALSNSIIHSDDIVPPDSSQQVESQQTQSSNSNASSALQESQNLPNAAIETTTLIKIVKPKKPLEMVPMANAGFGATSNKNGNSNNKTRKEQDLIALKRSGLGGSFSPTFGNVRGGIRVSNGGGGGAGVMSRPVVATQRFELTDDSDEEDLAIAKAITERLEFAPEMMSAGSAAVIAPIPSAPFAFDFDFDFDFSDSDDMMLGGSQQSNSFAPIQVGLSNNSVPSNSAPVDAEGSNGAPPPAQNNPPATSNGSGSSNSTGYPNGGGYYGPSTSQASGSGVNNNRVGYGGTTNPGAYPGFGGIAGGVGLNMPYEYGRTNSYIPPPIKAYVAPLPKRVIDQVSTEEDSAMKRARVTPTLPPPQSYRQQAYSTSNSQQPQPPTGNHYPPTYLASPSLARVQQSDPSLLSPATSPGRQRSLSPSPALAAGDQHPANSSRGVSPAAVPTLPELINASNSISNSDQTKQELIKFVSNPNGYTADPGQALFQRPSWAFELRRTTEKADLLIIRMDESSFALRRAPLHQMVDIQVAQSVFEAVPFSQSTTTSRAGTPVRASTPIPTVASPAPRVEARMSSAPPPTTTSAPSFTRDKLERDHNALQVQSNLQLAELVTLRPLTAEVTKLRSELNYLTTSNKRLIASKESASADYNFMKTQYDIASSAARDRAQEATNAEAQVASLKKLLNTGLKQREEFEKGKEKAWKEEVDRLRFELKMIKEQCRRSDGAEIRSKAALWESHIEHLKAGQEPENLALKAGDLLDEAEARKLEAVRIQIELEEEEKRKSTFLFDSTQRSLLLEEASQLEKSQDTTMSSGNSSDPMIFLCEWRENPSQACGEVLLTREDLREHTLTHLTPTI